MKKPFGKIWAWAGVAGLLMFATSRADAGLVVLSPTFSAAAGSSGTFDILLTNTGVSSVSIGGFSFGISTTNGGITFANATIATAATYIFAGDSLFGPNITIASGTSLTASDNPALATSFPVAGGATVGLGHVSYSIASGATTGPFILTLSPIATALADAVGGNVPINTLSSGTITVTSTTVTPEPATVGLGCIGLACLIALKSRVSKSKMRESFLAMRHQPR